MTCKRTKNAIALLVLLLVGPWTVGQQTPDGSLLPPQLSLQAAMELMLKQNPVLLSERQNLKIADANVRQARLLPNPDLEINSESYPIFESQPGSFLNNQELTFRAGQTIETGGKRGKRTLVARNELSATSSDLENTIRQLKLELKLRYYTVVLAKSQHDLAQENLKQFDEIIQLNEARFKQGELSGLEINRVRAERLRFFTDVLDSDLQLKNAKTALLELLGILDLNAAFDVAEKLGGGFGPPLHLPDLQAQALQTRPDLLAAQQRLERNRSDVQLQKSEAIPNVTPSFGYKRDFGMNTAVFGVTLPLPLFNRNQGGVARADAQVEQQRHEVQRAVLAVRRDVQESYQVLDTQTQKVRAMEENYVPSARNARDIGQQSYRLGALDLIALLDAERVYRDTVRSYNQALYDYKAAVFQLEAAVGKEF